MGFQLLVTNRNTGRAQILAFLSVLTSLLTAYSPSASTSQQLDYDAFLISGLITALPIAILLLLAFWLLYHKHPAERLPVLRSVIMIYFLFMIVHFIYLVLHEGGHSLYLLVRGVPITLYVHPFMLAGFSRPLIDSSIWKDILGSAIAFPVAFLISMPFWKRRSPTLLPLVMLFPYVALMDGINVMGIMGGDFVNLVQSTGLPASPFLMLGALMVCIGIFSLLSLFPIAGLNPNSNNALFVLPAAFFLWSANSFTVAHLFVPGSPIDIKYAVGAEIMLGANSFILLLIFGLFFSVLYVTLFRRLYPRLPAWLHNETKDLTWKDLRLPGTIWAISVAIGLIIII